MGHGAESGLDETRRWVLSFGQDVPRRLAAAIGSLPNSVAWPLLGSLLAVAFAGIAESFRLYRIPSLHSFSGISILGAACYLLVLVPLHELAHAVSCEMAGARVGAMGIVFRNALFPTPFVDTSRSYLIACTWKRFWIPAAGPVVDIIGLGAAAWVLCLSDRDMCGKSIAASLFTLGMICSYVNTSPLLASDGSRMLATLVNDDLARRNAFALHPGPASKPAMRVTYRAAACAHLLVGIAILSAWWACLCK
jgi:putative peptide zinc metalloprotease protein